MVPADGMMGKLTPLQVEQPLLFFKDWPSPPDELTQLNLPGMVGKLVCSFNVYYGSADGLAPGMGRAPCPCYSTLPFLLM